MSAAVGDTVRVDHGDKVVDRFVVEVTPTRVTSESRWVSGAPYVWGEYKPHAFRWTCSQDEWSAFIEGKT
jgi:hypothetical protein